MSGSWGLTGNAKTNPPTDFVGTSDNQPLVVKTGGTQRVSIDTSGSIEVSGALGIGTGTPRSLLEIEALVSYAGAGWPLAGFLAGLAPPALTITNSATDALGNTVAIDLNTYPPPPTKFPVTVVGDPQPGKIVFYNPAARIAAQSMGNFEADIVFLSNNPGAENNGLSERMRITPIGIGIGTTSPCSALEATVNASGTLGPVITLTNSGGGQNAAAALDLNTFNNTFNPSAAGTYNPSSRIEAVDDGNYANDIVFLSNNTGAPNNGLVERMRVTPAGVGIGTASPRSALEAAVNAGGALGPVITLTNTGGGQNTAAALDLNTFNPSLLGRYSYNPSSRIEAVDDGNFHNDIVFLTNNGVAPNNGLIETMRVTPAGIGISTSSPRSALEATVDASGALGPVITLTNTGGGRNAAAALDLNTFDILTASTYNPSSRIEAVDDGNYANDIVFLSNKTGAPNNGLIETMRVTPTGISVPGTISVGGDVILTGADCAEHFDVTGPILPEPGTVLVIDKEDSLRESTAAYDKRVAGVVSGAGEYRHALLLDCRLSDEPRVPLALTGKVYCKVDAQYSPVEVGDLLTTSPTPGHAMKATDVARAFGSVIGKALRALEGGQGLVPILVSLQ